MPEPTSVTQSDIALNALKSFGKEWWAPAAATTLGAAGLSGLYTSTRNLKPGETKGDRAKRTLRNMLYAGGATGAIWGGAAGVDALNTLNALPEPNAKGKYDVIGPGVGSVSSSGVTVDSSGKYNPYNPSPVYKGVNGIFGAGAGALGGFGANHLIRSNLGAGASLDAAIADRLNMEPVKKKLSGRTTNAARKAQFVRELFNTVDTNLQDRGVRRYSGHADNAVMSVDDLLDARVNVYNKLQNLVKGNKEGIKPGDVRGTMSPRSRAQLFLRGAGESGAPRRGKMPGWASVLPVLGGLAGLGSGYDSHDRSYAGRLLDAFLGKD